MRCLATIISTHFVWICVRLDGEDGSNDHWLICDDECISPVGCVMQRCHFSMNSFENKIHMSLSTPA